MQCVEPGAHKPQRARGAPRHRVQGALRGPHTQARAAGSHACALRRIVPLVRSHVTRCVPCVPCVPCARRHAAEAEAAAAAAAEAHSAGRGREPLHYHAFDFHGNPTPVVFAHLAQFSESIFPHIGFFAQPPQARARARRRTHTRGQGVGEGEGEDEREWAPAEGGGDRAYVRFPLTADVLATCGDDGSLRGLCGAKDAEGAAEGTPSGQGQGQGQGPDDEGRLGAGACRGLLQRGVLRTNCVDCLDRTNVGQVRRWPAWKCVVRVEGFSHPGTPIPPPLLPAGTCRRLAPHHSPSRTHAHPPFYP